MIIHKGSYTNWEVTCLECLASVHHHEWAWFDYPVPHASGCSSCDASEERLRLSIQAERAVDAAWELNTERGL